MSDEKTLGQPAEDGPYAGLSAYGIAVTALERILDLDSGWMSWDEARGIASEAQRLAVTAAASEQPAPELAAAMGETRKVADAANVVLDAFTRGSDGYRARLSGVTLMRAYKAIGRPIPDHLRHLQGQ